MLWPVNLTTRAISRLQFLQGKHKGSKNLLITVSGGGCSGFQYNFELIDNTETKFRVIYDKDLIKVLSNDESLSIISGCTVDYKQELVGSKFVLDNIKNTSRKCSCGNSFDLEE
ncbi:iron-sulfur cluster assembly accessory protein domain-containing protein [Theileria equi strain WA]|uniref:Iron-sulfur cluster assembly accessory protein domain-containing protein n=1 Tax=Theileria equi strain WA TaxID=1537102 RepID=L0B1C4_THEEQ|nr:iron-sulfur cluster assembly accessory protein domain-containing protein [Theileria equi strain WA]AFZ81308.1 iron-sulfur cluster assembly accessory protein domain-containing protein [Theileria equi strain WA]|eukprot:XP_004830974.1 iron-sulfur cluster assembly accessory protein domain-containing protein [Theileria equi strain WA]